MYGNTVNAANGLKSKLKSTFGRDDATAYAHVGISGMNGLSDQQETTSPSTWTQIRDWANTNHIAGLERRTALYRTVTAGRRLLLLLDAARRAAQVRPLLPASGDCLVLVTSRSRLTDLSTRTVLSLRPLDRQEARGLLRQAVGAVPRRRRARERGGRPPGVLRTSAGPARGRGQSRRTAARSLQGDGPPTPRRRAPTA